jgi:hypothetical protein
MAATRCPECHEDTIEHDPPYAECYNCGWQGRARDLVEPRGDD